MKSKILRLFFAISGGVTLSLISMILTVLIAEALGSIADDPFVWTGFVNGTIAFAVLSGWAYKQIGK